MSADEQTSGPAPEARPDVSVCFLGDELVAGTGDPRSLGWVGRVAARTDVSRVRLTAHALGVPREGTTGMAARWPLEAGPRLGTRGRLVLGLGVADLREGIVSARSRLNVANVLDGAAERGLPALVVGPAPVLPGGPDAALQHRVAPLSDAFAEVCERRGVPYVDLFTPLRDNEDWLGDLATSEGGLPAQVGYGLIAYLVLHGGWGGWWSSAAPVARGW